ncbi:MAG: MoaD/ThiS family protein [Verrucomicrobiae bacterium]|nr:MoaD/ThiS family protein [Verrucomicrobiae bacterium]
MISIRIRYWSWFRDLTGTDSEELQVPEGLQLGELLDRVRTRHPRLAEARNCTLAAVGVDYQPATFQLSPGDEVSLFPPVQGG